MMRGSGEELTSNLRSLLLRGTMGESNVKGKKLEHAVNAIEGVIASLSIPEGTKVTLTLNKIVVIEGVKHEIDLWIEVEGMGIWLVECKNWKATVGKDVVIVFAEKIRATGAKGGFIAGLRFSKYAVAQAKLNPNLELKLATEDINLSSYFPAYHTVETLIRVEDSAVKLNFSGRVPPSLDGPVTYRSQHVPVQDFVKQLLKEIADERMAREPTQDRGGEVYTLTVPKTFKFRPGEAAMGPYLIDWIDAVSVFDVTVGIPELTWKFAVVDRGIAVSYHSELSEGYIDAVMIRTAKSATTQN